MRNARRAAGRIVAMAGVAPGATMDKSQPRRQVNRLPDFEVPRQVTRRIAEESEGGRREREIHELDQEFDAPAYTDKRPKAPVQDAYEQADRAYGDALDSVKSILKSGGGLGTVLDMAWDNTDDRKIAELCRTISGEVGGAGQWLLDLADALDRCVVTGNALNSAGGNLPSKFRPASRIHSSADGNRR